MLTGLCCYQLFRVSKHRDEQMQGTVPMNRRLHGVIPNRLHFKCPACGHEQVGPREMGGSFFRPTYKCNQCSKLAQLRNPWALPAVIGIGIGLSGAILAAAANSIVGNKLGWALTGFSLLIVYILVLWMAMPALSKAMCSWKSAEPTSSE